jgi:hypothetical protein
VQRFVNGFVTVCDDATLDVVEGFVAQFAGDGQADLRGSAYAGPVAVGDAASRLDHVVGLTGRVPGWDPTRSTQ